MSLVEVQEPLVASGLVPARDVPGALQADRRSVVSLIVYALNLVILSVLVEAGLGEIVSQAVAVVLVTPANFIGNKLWSFRRHR